MNPNMIVFAELPIEEVLPLIGISCDKGHINHKKRTEFQTNKGPLHIKVNTLRLRCFAKSIACASCGITGSLFRIEKAANDKQSGSPHLNLYARQGDELILMTRDHIIPLSRGGPDHLSNLQTYCYLCNEKKSNHIQGESTPCVT